MWYIPPFCETCVGWLRASVRSLRRASQRSKQSVGSYTSAVRASSITISGRRLSSARPVAVVRIELPATAATSADGGRTAAMPVVPAAFTPPLVLLLMGVALSSAPLSTKAFSVADAPMPSPMPRPCVPSTLLLALWLPLSKGSSLLGSR